MEPEEPELLEDTMARIPSLFGFGDPREKERCEETALWFLREECHARALLNYIEVPFIESTKLEGDQMLVECSDHASRDRLVCLSPFRLEDGSEVRLLPYHEEALAEILANKDSLLQPAPVDPPSADRLQWPGTKQVSAVKDELLRKRLCVFGRCKPNSWQGTDVVEFLNGYFDILVSLHVGFNKPVISTIWAYEGRAFFTLAFADELSRYVALLVKIFYFNATDSESKGYIYFEPFTGKRSQSTIVEIDTLPRILEPPSKAARVDKADPPPRLEPPIRVEPHPSRHVDPVAPPIRLEPPPVHTRLDAPPPIMKHPPPKTELPPPIQPPWRKEKEPEEPKAWYDMPGVSSGWEAVPGGRPGELQNTWDDVVEPGQEDDEMWGGRRPWRQDGHPRRGGDGRRLRDRDRDDGRGGMRDDVRNKRSKSRDRGDVTMSTRAQVLGSSFASSETHTRAMSVLVGKNIDQIYVWPSGVDTCTPRDGVALLSQHFVCIADNSRVPDVAKALAALIDYVVNEGLCQAPIIEGVYSAGGRCHVACYNRFSKALLCWCSNQGDRFFPPDSPIVRFRPYSNERLGPLDQSNLLNARIDPTPPEQEVLWADVKGSSVSAEVIRDLFLIVENKPKYWGMAKTVEYMRRKLQDIVHKPYISEYYSYDEESMGVAIMRSNKDAHWATLLGSIDIPIDDARKNVQNGLFRFLVFREPTEEDFSDICRVTRLSIAAPADVPETLLDELIGTLEEASRQQAQKTISQNSLKQVLCLIDSLTGDAAVAAYGR